MRNRQVRFTNGSARCLDSNDPKENEMTFLSEPRGFTAAEFKIYVSTLTWAKWRPEFVTLHNTAKPSLKQWVNFGLGKTQGAQRIRNLNSYYRNILGWHSGPHLFIAPDFIWLACDLEQDGVHASCFNRRSIGVEMVGDYSVEAFDNGDGAKVRDNAVASVAALYGRLKIDPTTLRFHKECKKDHHDCPGVRVKKEDFVARVTKALT